MLRRLIPLTISESLLITMMIMFSTVCVSFIFGLNTTLEIKCVWLGIYVASIGQGYAIRHILENLHDRETAIRNRAGKKDPGRR